MLQQALNMAEEASRRILETEFFERSSTVRFTGSVNNIYQCESEVNEVSHGRYNKNNYKGGYNKGNYKGKNEYYGKKDWNKNTKGSYQKKDEKKESKEQGCVSDSYKGCQILLSCRIQQKHICLHMQNDSREGRQC